MLICVNNHWREVTSSSTVKTGKCYLISIFNQTLRGGGGGFILMMQANVSVSFTKFTYVISTAVVRIKLNQLLSRVKKIELIK